MREARLARRGPNTHAPGCARRLACPVTRPSVARCATGAKEKQHRHKPVNSSARKWITSAKASTGRGRRSRPLPSASPKPVAPAYLSRRPRPAKRRMKHARKRCETGCVAQRARSRRPPGVRRRLKARSGANRVGRQLAPRYRSRRVLRLVDALQLKGRRRRGSPCARRALACDPPRHGGQPAPARRTPPRSMRARRSSCVELRDPLRLIGELLNQGPSASHSAVLNPSSR